MKLDQPGPFQYIKIQKFGRRHFCLQQNLVVLAWILFFNKDTINPNSKPDSNKITPKFVVRWLRRNFGLFRSNLRLLIIFAGYKYQLVRIDSMVRLPFYGHICVPVHKGYKIFDLRRRVVIKVFDNNVDTSSIARELEQLKTVSQIDFSPSIRRLDISERWYEEDYFSGFLDVSFNPPDSRTLLKRFSHELVQPLNSLIMFRQPIKKNVVEYIKEKMEVLEGSRLSRQESTVKDFKMIKSFLDSMVEYFRFEGECPFFLVFSHGDFCPENIMNTKYGIKVFDWESAMYRSALFDFYSYFFHRPHTYKIPLNTLISEINEALPIFISTMAKKIPDISTSILHYEDVYRRLYYIERISMLVEREMTDRNLNILKDHILRYIDIFAGYEETRIGTTLVRT